MALKTNITVDNLKYKDNIHEYYLASKEEVDRITNQINILNTKVTNYINDIINMRTTTIDQSVQYKVGALYLEIEGE